MATTLSEIRIAELMRPGLLRQVAQAELQVLRAAAKAELDPVRRLMYLRSRLSVVEALMEPRRQRAAAPSADTAPINAVADEGTGDESAADLLPISGFTAPAWPYRGIDDEDDDVDVAPPAGTPRPEDACRLASPPPADPPGGALIPDPAPAPAATAAGTAPQSSVPGAPSAVPAVLPVAERADCMYGEAAGALLDDQPLDDQPLEVELVFADHAELAQLDEVDQRHHRGRRSKPRPTLSQIDRRPQAAPRRARRKSDSDAHT